jgi:hypothetical protein
MEHDATPWKKIRRFLLFWAAITVAFLVELLIETYPDFPTDLNRWLIVLLIGPPIWLVVNLASEKFIGRPTTKALNRLGETKLRRINTILLYIIIVPIVLLLLVAIIRSLFE